MNEPWIQIYNGMAWQPLMPEVNKIDLETIATVLSRLCRFNGHTTEFYSVAQHSVYVSKILPPKLKIAGLLHDAHEAYTGFGDVCSPMKKLFPDLNFMERNIDCAIAGAFNFSVVLFGSLLVRGADMIMLATEARDLMLAPPIPWLDMPAPLEEHILAMTSEQSKEWFLREARSLGLK